ncbi:Uncharacterised protein [uncultured archaeon]|nr:Uncharacterised protein [uncultured archaeon]
MRHYRVANRLELMEKRISDVDLYCKHTDQCDPTKCASFKIRGSNYYCAGKFAPAV